MNDSRPSIELVETEEEDESYFALPHQRSSSEGLSVSVTHQQSRIAKDVDDDFNNCSILLYSNEENNHYLVSKVDEFEELLRQHEVKTYTKYTIYKTNGTFKGKGKDPKRKPRVHWGVLSKVSPELATTPYLIVGTRYYVCHLGKCYYTSKLQKYATQRDQGNHKRYKKITSSKKVGCPANFKVQRLIVFPDNKLTFDTPSERARMGNYIRKNISNVKIQHKYLFRFPHQREHSHTHQKVAAAAKEPVDKRVNDKIKEIVNSGRTSVHSVTEILEEFVQNELNVNDKNRRRFFPSKVDIRRLIYNAKVKLRRAKNDQEKVEEIKHSLGSENEVYFHPATFDSRMVNSKDWCGNNGDNSIPRKTGLLFVYQNSEMKKLYRRYGQHCIILDATYKFCKYSFPLYLMAVQTNVTYLVVALFITEFESKESLVDALHIVAHWNPTVIPKYGMTDNNIDEVKALQTVFPAIKVFFAKYYRENSWKQRLSMKDMRNVDKVEAFQKLTAIADSLTQDETQKAINDFKEWNLLNDSLKIYFDKSWQREIKRWALAYRPLDLLFETNDAVNRLDEEFSYLLLSQMRHWMLSQVVVRLCRNFIPCKYQYYKALNIAIVNRNLNNELHIPSYMYDSPQWFLDYIHMTTIEAEKSLSHTYIEVICDGHFSLYIKDTNTKYDVKFDLDKKLATCTCLEFLKRKLICKHAITIGRFYPMWNIEKISSWLFDHNIFKLDRTFVTESTTIIPKKCEVQFDTLENESEKIVVGNKNVNNNNLNINLRERCRQSISSMESMLDLMNNEDLSKFQRSLLSFTKLWSNKILKQESMLSEKEKDDIPFPMLQKISDFYANKLVSQDTLIVKRKYKKSKRKENPLKKKISLSNRKKKLKLHGQTASKETDDIKTCNITTIYKEERADTNVPIFSIKIEGKESLDPAKTFEANKEAIEDYFEEESNVIIHINNPDEESN